MLLTRSRVIAQLKGIHLVHDLEEADEGMILADQSLLTRALFNVLENAIKYSPAGTTVRLSHSSAQGWLECCISDQGPGIAAEDLPQLFSQYRRSLIPPRQRRFGVGADHGQGCCGASWWSSVASIVGKGTTFSLQLLLDWTERRAFVLCIKNRSRGPVF
jgi:K+-sensing histidine kinase KdpD